MECKVNQCNNSIDRHFVLIETLWNVKMANAVLSCGGELGINRNIMECKVLS